MRTIENKAKKIILILTIIIILNTILAVSLKTNITYAANNVVYEKKLEILSTPDVDTSNRNITSRDRDVYEEEQKEEALKKEAEERRNVLKDNQNVYMIIVIIVILIIIGISIYMLINGNNNRRKKKARISKNKKINNKREICIKKINM